MYDSTQVSDLERLAFWALRTLHLDSAQLRDLLHAWCRSSNATVAPALVTLLAAHATRVHNEQVTA